MGDGGDEGTCPVASAALTAPLFSGAAIVSVVADGDCACASDGVGVGLLVLLTLLSPPPPSSPPRLTLPPSLSEFGVKDELQCPQTCWPH